MVDPVFFTPLRQFTAAEIAAFTGSQLVGESECGDIIVSGIAPASEGGEGKLVYIDHRRHAHLLPGLAAAAILCTAELSDRVPAGMARLVTPYPQQAFALAGRMMYPSAVSPRPLTGETGVSSRAFLAPTCRVEKGAIIEAGAVIGENAEIGAGTVVAPNAVIGLSCRVGRDCFIGPNTTLQYALVGDRVFIHGGAQIGQDGFGFVGGARGPERIPQIGRVVVQNDVEIGANTTVDRGAMTDTVIGEGSKIDNLVQIAHNVRIGRGCVIAGHCGLSGSVTVGDFVMLGGRVGIADHISIGDRAQIAASSGLMHDVPAGEKWAGSPARPMREFFKEVAAIRKLMKPKTSKGESDG